MNNYDRLCETCHERLHKNPMRILDCKNKECKNVAASAPDILSYICPECDEHFKKVQGYLDEMGVQYNIDPSIVRGLDYYTRTVFEFVSNEIGAQGTICGGGRYDNLLELLDGGDIPGIGFALGVERTILVMKAQGVLPGDSIAPDIYIASAGEPMAVLKLACELRREGIYAECDHLGRSLKAQMKNADRFGARFSTVIGDEEIKSGKIKIKNMIDGSVFDSDLNASSIKKIIGS